MKENYIQDLKEIREMMNRSSRFISLSGLSGISAGILALIGAYLAHKVIYASHGVQIYERVALDAESLIQLLAIAAGTLLLAVASGIYFTTRETKKHHQKIWDHQTKRLLINLAIPLFTGGIFCLMLLFNGYVGLVAPLTLIFYGLALVNASKYTLTEIRGLGLAEIFLGLASTYFICHGLLFWALGFGLLHVAYGIAMQRKYSS